MIFKKSLFNKYYIHTIMMSHRKVCLSVFVHWGVRILQLKGFSLKKNCVLHQSFNAQNVVQQFFMVANLPQMIHSGKGLKLMKPWSQNLFRVVYLPLVTDLMVGNLF